MCSLKHHINTMMKKFFKNPSEAKKSDATSVMKVLKKVFLKGVEGSSFFYKAEFDYDNGEPAPFLYIGSESALWKKYTKASKKDKDFVGGVCKLEGGENGQAQKLLLKAEVGKGSKAAFLKAVNRDLLKKLSIKAEFVDELSVEIEASDSEETVEDAPTPSTFSVEELNTEFKSISGELKLIQVEYSEKQVDALLDKIEDWEDGYKGLPTEEQKKLASEKDNAKKVAAYLQKINQVDSKIDLLFDKVEILITSYLAMEEHDSKEALVAKKKLEKAIEKTEALAKKINDKSFIEACQEFREVLMA